MQKQQSGSELAMARTTDKPSFWQRRLVIGLGTGVLFGLLVLGLRYLAESLTHEATDDAFLDANIVAVAPRVSGRVSSVPVKSNEAVKEGNLLVEIDSRDFAVQLAQRQAALKAAQANLELLKASLDLRQTQIGTAEAMTKQSAAEVTAAEANAQKASADLKRAEELIQNHTISPQEYDSAKAAAAAAEANLKAARERTSSEQSKITEARAEFERSRKALEWGKAQEHQAEADVQAAELTLSYTHIMAPTNGYVTKKSVETGDYVQAGQKLMALVPHDLYVTANFKETQLHNIRPGQPARIEIDSTGGRTFRGHVDSIMAGSGARFSLLPPENAVGNYVKVVQRIPVKILFDERPEAGHVLGPGMSVVPYVKVKGYEIPEWAIIILAGVGALAIGALWWRATSRAQRRRQAPGAEA
jgi:membrane fusion protein (multidrug efflux system)